MRHTHATPSRSLALVAMLTVAALALSACRSAGDGVASAGEPSEAEMDEAGMDEAGMDDGATLPSVPAATVAPATTVPEPVCEVVAEPGDSLIGIAERNGITVEELQRENLLDPTDVFHPGQEFDVCVGDPVDTSDPTLTAPISVAVIRQQHELNELFSSTSMIPLDIDGDSGKLTRQAICAARMGLGLPVHNRHLVPGSDEETAIFAATELGIPEGAPTEAARWILVDQTCQVIFIGEGDERVVDVFPTSTGEAGHETFTVTARAFRFDPAVDNEGWHDSASYPVEVDNPLNGNMYKPIYFNDGQAIHGAEFVPPFPRSKGCARTFPKHQDMIVEWLGLQDLTEATWSISEIAATVVVQGRYTDVVAPA